MAEFIAISLGECRLQPRQDVGFEEAALEEWEFEQRIRHSGELKNICGKGWN
jgi:hypothetical protein